MKKFFLSAAVLVSMSLAACGGSSAQNGENCCEGDSASCCEATEQVDAEAAATATSSETAATIIEKVKACSSVDDAKAIADDVQTYVSQLIAEGKVEEAKSYLESVAPTITAKYPELASKVSSISALLDKVPTSTEAAAAAAKTAAETKANEAVQDAKDKANDAVNNAVNDAASKVKDKLKI